MEYFERARDGRDSPLKYTAERGQLVPEALGMAGIHRSSTLTVAAGIVTYTLGMAGIHRSSTLEERLEVDREQLGMAGIHRSSTL